MSKKIIGIVVGSLRKDSFNRSIANYVASIIPEEFEVRFIDISKVDMFDQDLESNPPHSWIQLREEVAAADAYLFVTPEYNRSIPGALKNALDVASRPYGQSVWGGKAGGVISVSLGGIAAFGANHHLRQILTFLNVFTLQQPEAYIGNVMSLLDEKGELVSGDTKNFLRSYVEAYVNWVKKF